MEPFLAQIVFFGGNFAPRGWAFCEGQLLPISQYSALFSLLGTTYGGDGRTTFALPDLRGRSIISPGNGPGLSPFSVGQKGGAEQVTLTLNNLPSHNHVIPATNGTATFGGNAEAGGAAGNFFSNTATNTDGADHNVEGAVTIPQHNTQNNGGNQGFQIRDPYVAIYAIIALQGVFPSRS